MREYLMTPEFDSAMNSAGSKATYAGAGMTGVGWLFTSEAAIAVGIFVGVIGLIVQIIFGVRKDRRDQEFHRARMRSLNRDEHEEAGV